MITIPASAELLRIGNFSVQTWGFIVALGIILSIIFLFIEAGKKKKLDETENLIACIAIFAIIGARIAYILINPKEFSNFIDIINIWKGGMISYGALLGAFVGILIFKLIAKTKSENLFKLLDLIAPYLILAIAIGRIGCFLRGCCFGIPTNLPWGVLYTGENALAEGAVHPTQIYHSILDFIIFFILLKINRKKGKLEKKKIKSKYILFNIPGSTFMLFIMLYCFERFFVDFFRFHPTSEYIGMISITQIVFLFISAAAWLALKKIKKRKNKRDQQSSTSLKSSSSYSSSSSSSAYAIFF
jgi:phosphatidylglycerol:prolipoprotein diacylglycerol transferase